MLTVPAVLLLLLVLLADAVHTSSRSQVGGPVYNSETGHWYEAIAVPGGITWADARIAAQARSHQGLPGYLATPTHSEENHFIADNFPNAVSDSYALGGMQPPGTTDPTPGWFWITGEEWWYDFWDEFQPRVLGEAGVLVYLGEAEFRNVRPSTVVSGYVVEYGTTPPLVPSLKFRRSTLILANPRELTCADFDEDGNLDLSAGAPAGLVIFYGNGNGTFEAAATLALPRAANEMVAEDLDGDGDPDIATITDFGVYVLRKLAGRNYAPPDKYDVVAGAALHARDLNGDNRPELIAGNQTYHRVWILMNQGNGTFAAGDNESVPSFPHRIQTADWTGDGHIDVAIDAMLPGDVYVFAGNGSGSITPLTRHTTEADHPTGMRAVDFNQDGSLDLVVALPFNDTVGILYSRGGGQFDPIVKYPGGSYPHFLEVPDIDGDGDPDVVQTNGRNATYFAVLKNDGAGVLTRPYAIPSSGPDNPHLTVGDFNEDGKPDVAVACVGVGQIAVLLNETPFPPTAFRPANLTATAVGPIQINLAWEDRSSTETAFELERRTGSASFAPIATLPANTIGYSDTGLEPDTLYQYRVRALLPAAPTPYSNVASAQTLPPTSGGPTSLVVTVLGGTELDLTWVDNSSNESAFQVQRRSGADAFQVIAVLGPNVTRYDNINLQPDTQYTYRVRALTPQGPTLYSNESTATTTPLQLLPPDQLTAAARSSTSVDLRWRDRSDVETAFEVERKEGGNSFTTVTATAANALRFTDTGLTPQTTYTYRVRALFPSGPTSYSNQAQATTFTPGVFPPENLAASVFSAVEIRLTWEDQSANETGFEIERQDAAGDFVLLSTTAAGATSYADTGLQPDTIYAYRIRAVTPSGTTGYSNEAVAATPQLVLEPPAGLSANAVSHQQINLAWIDTSSLELTFQIERRIGMGSFNLLATVSANSTSYQDPNLTPETSYSYRVRAVRNPNFSSFSNTATATTSETPLQVPANLEAGAVSSTEIRMTWRDESDNETGFQVERKPSGGVFAQIATAGAAAGIGTTVRYSDTSGLAANSTYVYRVRTVKGALFSAYSNEAQVTATPLVPTAPTNLTATLTASTSIQLAWADLSNNETGFRVERKTGPSGSFTFIGTAAADTFVFPDPGLAPDTLYTYHIRAVGNAGSSAFSNEAVSATSPQAPASVTVTVGSLGQLNVGWTDVSQSETGFKIERKTGGLAYSTAGTVAAGVTTFGDSGLSAGTTYTYRVRSVNQGGDSAPSNEASRLTLPAVPTSLAVSAPSSSQLLLTWSDGNPSPPAVKVERGLSAVGPFNQVGTSNIASTSFQDTGLAPTTTYYYRVRATNLSGDSGYSSVASGTTLPPPPVAPSNLTGVAVSGRSVQVSWNDNSGNETGFEIFRLSPQGGGYQLVATTGANATGYLDAGLIGSNSYGYRVRAVNAGGGSAFVGPVKVSTLPDPPAAPTILSAVALAYNQVQLNWLDSSDNELGFRIQHKLEGGSYQTVATTGSSVTEHVNGSLSEGTRYTYRIVAFNNHGDTPSQDVAVITRPQSPGNVTATAGNRRIDLSWVDRSARETGFRIERRAGSGSFSTVFTAPPSAVSFGDTGVTAENTYTYRVIAVSLEGDSEPSGTSTATPRNETPLARLVISPGAIKFGAVKLTRSKQKTLKLSNKGKEPVMGVIGVVDAPFAVISGGGSFALAPKSSRKVVITFTPTAAGPAQASLRVTSTDPTAPQKDLVLGGTGR